MQGNLIDVNRQFASYLGYSIEQLENMNYREITPDKYSDQEVERINELEREGRYGPYGKEFIDCHGSLVPVILHGLKIELDGREFIWSIVERGVIAGDVRGSTDEEVRQIQGPWQLRKLVVDGEDVEMDSAGLGYLTIGGNFYRPQSASIDAPCSYTIDISTAPKSIDFYPGNNSAAADTTGLRPDSGQAGPLKGIYNLVAGDLTICRALTSGGERPNEFAVPAGSGRLLVVWTRIAQRVDDAASSHVPIKPPSASLEELKRPIQPDQAVERVYRARRTPAHPRTSLALRSLARIKRGPRSPVNPIGRPRLRIPDNDLSAARLRVSLEYLQESQGGMHGVAHGVKAGPLSDLLEAFETGFIEVEDDFRAWHRTLLRATEISS